MARPINGTTFWDRVNAQLRHLENGCIVFTGNKDDSGYGRITKNGKLVRIHREVWLRENPDQTITGVIMHSCDNPSCINPAHLSHGTQAENIADMVAKGRRVVVKGSNQPDAKLTESDIPVIRQLLIDGKSCSKIALQYKVSPEAIRAIKKGRSWVHVPLPDGSDGKNFFIPKKSKITEKDIPVIRKLLLEGMTCRAIGEIYNVGEFAIRSIKSGQNWSHVP
jgi:transposase